MKYAFEFMRAAIPAGALLACLAIHPSAQAETRPEKKELVTRVRVTYADLDLTRQLDAQVVLGRIQAAAFRACGGNPRRHIRYDVMPGRVEAVFKECREEAVARAIREIHAPALSQAHLATPQT
jgi:UrcA family protein